MNNIDLELDEQTTPPVCRHEWLADLASGLAVILLFGTVFLIMRYHNVTLEWMLGNSLLENIAAHAILFLDVVLIVSLLCFGPSCNTNNKRCFGTFKGRQH